MTTSTLPRSAGSPETLLVSYAMLSETFDSRQTTHSDNFLPFVGEALGTLSGTVRVEELRQQLVELFGLRIPAAVVKSLLKKAQKKKWGTIQRDGFRAGTGLPPFSIRADSAKFKRGLHALADGLVKHADSLECPLSSDEAKGLLLDAVQEWSLPLLRTSLTGEPFEPSPSDQQSRLLVHTYIARVLERSPEEAQYLEGLVKGSMLASSLYTKLGIESPRRFGRGARAVLDTPILLSVLGANGKEQQDAASEVLALGRRHGLTPVYLDITEREVAGVLRAGIGRRRPGTKHAYFGPTLAVSPVEAERLLVRLDRALAEGGLSRVACPDPVPGDAEVAAELEAALDWHGSDAAKDHDVRALMAVRRLQGSEPRSRIEDYKAIFVTSNDRLARDAHVALYRNGPMMAPAVLPDHELATLLWLKDPTEAPDLPMTQLIADCHAALNPDNKLWSAFLLRVEELRKGDAISEEDYHLLRGGLHEESRLLLAEATLGDPGRLSSSSAAHLATKIREEIESRAVAPYAEDLERAKAAEQEALAARDTALESGREEAVALRSESDEREQRARLEGRNDALRAQAGRFGAAVLWGALLVLGALLVWGGYLVQVSSLDGLTQAERLASSGFAVVVVLGSLWTLRPVFRWTKDAVSDRRFAALVRRANSAD